MANKVPRVLIVDDESFIVTELGEYLAHKGVDVLYADSGNAALALLSAQRETPLTHMVVDLRMPPPDGFAVIEAVAGSGAPAPVIVAVSGHASAGDEQRARDLGAVHFLPKPYDLGALTRIIRGEV